MKFNEYQDPLTLINAPKLDTDFSQYVVINNLPRVEEAKAELLKKVLVKLTDAKGITINPAELEMPLRGKDTYGCAFLRMKSEKEANELISKIDGL